MLHRRDFGRTPSNDEFNKPASHVEREAIEQVLRILHAKQAENLGILKYTNQNSGDECYLIEHHDMRSRYGLLIGRIAHSHWWSVSKLRKEFQEMLGAAPGYPPTWTVDPLKIACLLRVADACHLDERRAPRFKEMILKPNGVSELHWRFQSHLQIPLVEDQKLIFTSTSPFSIEESNAWWLCHDALKTADEELRKVDSLLRETKRKPLLANRIAGINDFKDLSELVTTNGWTPVDTRIRVGNVVSLVGKLGGFQLYGHDLSLPLRELIQNASDAIRARRIIENREEKWGQIAIRLGEDNEGNWIQIADNGFGMSQAVLTGPLLDFGSSYWESTLVTQEHPCLFQRVLSLQVNMG